MMTHRHSATAVLGSAIFLVAVQANAQTTVTLPSTSQTTTLSATVSEQARVLVPATVAFTVTNLNNATAASAATLTIDQIALATLTKQLQVSIQATAASFTAPGAGITWSASDVTWNAASWTSGTGAGGTLSNGAYTTVATCNAGVASCSTTGLVFTLGAKPTVNVAGAHTLVVTWKFESIGS